MNEDQNINVETTELHEGETVTAPQTYTQADIDRVISKMAEKFETKYDKKYKQQITLAGLDEKERAIAEKDIALKEMEERLKNYELSQSRMELTKVLGTRGLSTELIDIINVTGDVEQDQKMIDTLDKVFKAMVKTEVEKRIGSSTPKTSTVGLEQGMTKEKLAKLSYDQQVAYLTEHPDFI